MIENKQKISRKEYFRNYYLKNKENRKDDKTTNGKKKRGRPRKVIPPFSIRKLNKPITIKFE